MNSSFKHYISQLKEAFNKPLPGFQAQMQMGRRKVAEHRLFQDVPSHAVDSAVLVLFYPHHHDVYLPLIVRPNYDGVHSGQTALPGGRSEKGDVDFYHTALREAQEEIGVDVSTINYIGALTPLYIPPSNFLVHPYVAYTNERPRFIKDEKEVEQIVEAKWDDFLVDENVRSKVFNPSGSNGVEAYYFHVAGREIWGATAMMLNELKTLLAR